VGDRLVSSVKGGKVSEHDPRANKQVIVIARDALASIGYTGLAYLGDRPTDDVLAEVAAGSSLGQGMMAGGVDVGTAYEVAERIRGHLDNLFSKSPSEYGFEVAITGLKRGNATASNPSCGRLK
jgi:hypothetical protein